MSRLGAVATLLLIVACSSPPPPTAPPQAAPPPPPVSAPAEAAVRGQVRVTASTLNVRASASGDAAVVAQVRRGDSLAVLKEEGGWSNVQLPDGRSGWVSSRFVTSGDVPRTSRSTPKRGTRSGGCESDYAFLQPPTLSFSDSGAHGIVVVEANVSAKGLVTATRVVSNSTGDKALAAVAEREIKGARFSPPMRGCVPRSFLFTYRRTF